MWKLVAAPTGWPDAQPPELSIPFPKDTDTLVIGTPSTPVSAHAPPLLPLSSRCDIRSAGRDTLAADGIINKRVSRTQVTLKRNADGSVTAELSGLNASVVNEDKLEKGKAHPLKKGDVLKLLPDFGHFVVVCEDTKPGGGDTEEDEPLAAAGPKRRLLDSDAAAPKRARSVKEEEAPSILARQPSVASMERVRFPPGLHVPHLYILSH